MKELPSYFIQKPLPNSKKLLSVLVFIFIENYNQSAKENREKFLTQKLNV